MGDLAKKRYILLKDASLNKGDKGDKGDPGTSGPGGALPINTSDVLHDGTVRNGENLRDLIDEIFYEPVVALAFAPTSGVTVLEKGTVLTSISVEWSLSKTIPTGSQTITGADIDSPTLAVGDRDDIITATGAGISDNSTITLSVSDGDALEQSPSTRSFTFQFQWPVFFGGAEDPGTITNSWLQTTLDSQLRANKSVSFSVSAVVDEYAWFACPSSYGNPSFTVNGFGADFVQVHGTGDFFSYTTVAGATTDYYVYRSENTEQNQDINVS